MANRVNDAVQIVEGKIVKKYSTWDEGRNNIYTVNTIEIFKIFKGNKDVSYVDILTLGGIVGFDAQVVEPSLQLAVGEVGLFFLIKQQSKISLQRVTTEPLYQPKAGPQGFIIYSIEKGVGTDHFNMYTDIKRDLYQKISALTKKEFVEVQQFSLEKLKRKAKNNRQLAFTFSPTTITAGTDAILTISDPGGGLGTQGVVEFTNADVGSAVIDIAALDAEVCSWTTTEIQVQVPTRAGSGLFEVIPDGQSAIISSSSLTVRYSQLNVTSGFTGTTDTYQTQHYNENGLGGYTLQMNDDFATSGADAPFLRSLETWCAATNIHWELGDNTNIDSDGSDGVNIVRFDNGNELPSGVLGRCTSYWSGCTNGTPKDCVNGENDMNWIVEELDIVFDDGITWNFGPDATTTGEFDFETVSLHELGHAHQLGHVRETTQVMYFRTPVATDKRSLSTDEIDGALDVYDRSTTNQVCGQPLMSTNINCSTLLPVELIDFNVEQSRKSASLFWSTASEMNNQGFEIQRSNKNNDFVTIGFVRGNGSTNIERYYEYEDNSPLGGYNYYRLKQVDYDGNFSYSEVRSAYFSFSENELAIFPVPVKGNHLKLKSIMTEDIQATIDVMDITGNTLSSQSILLREGVSITPLSIENYPAGSYFVKCQFGKRIELLKFLKSN